MHILEILELLAMTVGIFQCFRVKVIGVTEAQLLKLLQFVLYFRWRNYVTYFKTYKYLCESFSPALILPPAVHPQVLTCSCLLSSFSFF